MRTLRHQVDRPPPVVPPGPVTWGLQDAVVWFLIAQIGAAFWVAGVVALLHGDDRPEMLPIETLVVGQIVLWFGYGVGPLIVSWRKGEGPVRDYGLRLRGADPVVGVLTGIGLQLVVLPILYFPLLRLTDADPGASAEELVDRVDGALDELLLVLLVVVAAPAVEELFYRGLVLRSLQMRIGPWPAILVSSALFAVVHIEPILMPGLFVFGVVAGWLAVRTGRLGPSWLMHVAFNATTLTLLLRS